MIYTSILIVSLVTRLYHLDSIGFVWDEVLYATYSKDLFNTLFTGVNLEHPPLLKLLLAPFVTWTFSEGTIRIPVALISALAPLLAYLIAEKLYGDLIAVASSFLIIFDVNLMAYSRLATMDALLTTLALLSTYLALRGRSVSASAALSLAILTRFDGILLIPILALTGFLEHRSHKKLHKDLLIYITAAGLTLIGWLFWLAFINKLNLLFAHYSTITITNTYPALLAETIYKLSPISIALIPFGVIAPFLGGSPIPILAAAMWSLPRGILPYVGVRYHLYSIALIYLAGLDGLRRVQRFIAKSRKVTIALAISAVTVNILISASTYPYLISYLNPWSSRPILYLSDSDLGQGSALREALQKLDDPKIVIVNYAPHIVRIYLRSAKIYSVPPLMNYSKPELSALELRTGSYFVRYIVGGKDWFYDPIIEELAGEGLIVQTLNRGGQEVVIYDLSRKFREGEIKFWINVAKIAWSYFRPGIGVSAKTGLNYANQWWHRITDWDLASYLSAIISARKLGLIDEEEFEARVEKILYFLETRKLTPKGMPYLSYNSDTGEPATAMGSNPSDAGKLLLALDSLKSFRPSYKERVKEIVRRNGMKKIAIDPKAWRTTCGAYAHYVATGFKKFGLAGYPHIIEKLRFYQALGKMELIKSHGADLPKAWITYEPILLEVYELNHTEAREFLRRLIEASKLRFRETGHLSAFSEGSIEDPPYYVYEWIVADGLGTWVITDHEGRRLNLTEVIYTKVALGVYAYEGSDYGRILIDEVLPLTMTENGFYEGIREDRKPIKILTDKTNSLILSIALYRLVELQAIKA